jgi:hypothetical protein
MVEILDLAKRSPRSSEYQKRQAGESHLYIIASCQRLNVPLRKGSPKAQAPTRHPTANTMHSAAVALATDGPGHSAANATMTANLKARRRSAPIA